MSDDKVMGVSAEAVLKATGREWDGWFGLLDEAGARQWDHKRMVAFVAGRGLDSGWWQQMVTSSYERARGLKKVGQSSGVGFQIGVQRTIPVGREALWELLTGEDGVALWLGTTDSFEAEQGFCYRTAEGVEGEIRRVHPRDRIRLTWQPPELEQPTTLQVTLSCPRNTDERTTLRFHQEKLLDVDHREQMRAHWKAVAAKIVEAVRARG